VIEVEGNGEGPGTAVRGRIADRDRCTVSGRGKGGAAGIQLAGGDDDWQVEEGDAFQGWRADIRALFRSVLEDSDLDGLFFPQAGAPIGDLVEDPERPDFNPNNHPELPSNVINDIGLPVVTVPFGYYADGTPFVLAFIGDLWTEAALLGFAYDLEQATKARIPPQLR